MQFIKKYIYNFCNDSLKHKSNFICPKNYVSYEIYYIDL